MARIQLIIGHVTPRTARIWVRGRIGDKQAQLEYWKTDAPDEITREEITLPDRPELHQANVIELKDLSPGTKYILSAKFKNGETRSGELRTPPGDNRPFSFLLVSCNKNKQNRRRNYQGVHARFRNDDLRFIVHCGDQVYYDHESDTRNPPSAELYAKRYDQTWGHDGYASEMLASFPNYMMLDDHEIANDCNKRDMNEKEGHYSMNAYAKHGIPAYHAFQVLHGPGLHPSPVADHTRYDYSFEHGDVKFFAMDVRLDRQPFRSGAGVGEMIGPDQEESLMNWMRANKDAMKFIITSIPFVGDVTYLTERVGEHKWSSDCFKHQRARILRFIADEEIRGLVFLTGDMHAAYHADMHIKRRDGKILVVHELMSSPVYHKWRPWFGTGLRNRIRRINLPGGHRVLGNIGRIFPRPNVMKIEVDPARRAVAWTIHSLKNKRDLQRREFGV